MKLPLACLAAGILLTALCGGFFVGAFNAFTEDTGESW
jgi:hypothetical protein